ncbi:hypothetical protein RCL1_007801 [Eukaryota sp. TZLM3-RCL]
MSSNSSLLNAILSNNTFQLRALLSELHNKNERNSDLRTVLHHAVIQSNSAAVRILLSNNFYPTPLDIYQRIPLHYACLLPDPSIAQLLLSSKLPSLVNSPDHSSFTPLHLACSKGDSLFVTVTNLIASGADINILTKKKYSPLLLCAESNAVKISGLLLDLGCSVVVPSEKKNRGKSPLHVAVKSNKMDVLMYLLSRREVPKNTKQFKLGATALHVAAKYNNLTAFKILINSGCELTSTTDYNWSCLHLSVESGCIETTNYLLSLNNSKLNSIRTVNGRSPLHVALKKNLDQNFDLQKSLEIVKLLMQKFDINEPDSNGLTPFHLAIGSNFYEILDLLTPDDVDVNISENSFNYQPIHIAILHSNQNTPKIIENLVSKFGANVNSKAHSGWTPLLLACSFLDLEIFQKLIDLGADDVALDDVSKKDVYCLIASTRSESKVDAALAVLSLLISTFNPSPQSLSRALSFCQLPSICDFLLANGAQVNHILDSPTHSRSCPLSLSNSPCFCPQGPPLLSLIRDSNFPMVIKLVSEGAFIDCVSANYWTPVMLACESDNLEILKFLIDKGADVKYKKSNELDAFLVCCRFGSINCLKFLVEISDVEPSKRLVIEAVSSGQTEILSFLIESNIGDFNLIDCLTGLSPLMIAVQKNSLEMSRLLIDCNHVDTDLIATDGHSALSFSMSLDKIPVEISKLLIERGSSIIVINNNGQNCLHLLANSSCFVPNDLLKSLLSHSTINSFDCFGFCPLHYACKKGNLILATLLLKSGGFVNSRSKFENKLPIYFALINDFISLVSLLFEYGSVIEDFENSENLLVSCYNSSAFQSLKILIDFGANVTPLVEHVKSLNLDRKSKDYAFFENLLRS